MVIVFDSHPNDLRGRRDRNVDRDAGAAEAIDERVTESRRRRQHTALLAAAGQRVRVERKAQRRLADEANGGAIAGIALVFDQSANSLAAL